MHDAVRRQHRKQNMYNLAYRHDDKLIDLLAEQGIACVPFFPLGGFAWLLRRSPNILLIPGTSSTAHLRENVAGAGLLLSAGELAELDKIGR